MILASSSPQRLALLRAHGVEPRVVPAHVDESPHAGEGPADLVARLATAKARVVAAAHPDEVVLAADTVVALDGTSLGKPVDDDHARVLLRRLAAAQALVTTHVTVVGPDGTGTAAAVTTLRFRDLDEDEVEAYVATGEPRGAAGGFRLQGRGAQLVAHRRGCRTNVVGLPVCLAATLLAPHGVALRRDACPP